MNFLRGVGQPVRVDVDSDAATRTGHVFVRLQAPDRLSEVLSAARTLKPDLVQIRAGHRKRLWFERAGPGFASRRDYRQHPREKAPAQEFTMMYFAKDVYTEDKFYILEKYISEATGFIAPSFLFDNCSLDGNHSGNN